MADDFSPDEVQQIRDAIFAGRKIEAIKLCREATGKGLKESKEFVEGLEARLRQESPEQFKAGSPGSGCSGVLLVVAVLIGVALYGLAG